MKYSETLTKKKSSFIRSTNIKFKVYFDKHNIKKKKKKNVKIKNH